MVRRKVQTPHRFWKDGSIVIFYSFTELNANIVTIKAYLEVILVSETLKLQIIVLHF